MKKKCNECGEIKSSKNFYKRKTVKSGLESWCSTCKVKAVTKYKNTEEGFLKMRFSAIACRFKRRDRATQQIHKCYFTFKQFNTAWQKHKKKYGMRSHWGPPVPPLSNLKYHLPLTMIYGGMKNSLGKRGPMKNRKVVPSNLSPDRLDPGRPYTIQNLIFLRSDENDRKKHTTYNDSLVQKRLYEERFIDMRSI